MSRRLRRFEIIEHHHNSSSPTPYLYEKTTTIYKPSPTKTLTMPNPWFPFPILDDEIELLNFDEFHTITDLIQIDESPFRTTRRVTRRIGSGAELYLQSLSDRVSDLELGLEKLLKEEKSKKKKKEKEKVEERKYTWTAEIKNPDKEKKFKWTAEIKDDGEKKGVEKSYKWTAAIKGKGDTERTYTVEVSSGGSDKKKKCGKDKKEKEKEKAKAVEPPIARVVEIEEPAAHHGAIVLRKTFAKRVEKKRGKRTEMSLQDAATLIQISFRAYLIRRSQSLRALRELAIAKSKLKEIRALFNNFTYRRRLSRDAEERQRFSEKLIVLLLTVDAIEGADVIVRAAKKSMVDELEAMLDVVDPQPAGKSLSIRRTFDMPDGAINQELAKGVAQVVRMLDEEADSETFEASA